MATADDLINDAISYAGNQAANAGSIALSVFALITKLLNPRYRQRPWWDPASSPELEDYISPSDISKADAGVTFADTRGIVWSAPNAVPQRKAHEGTFPEFESTSKAAPTFDENTPGASTAVRDMVAVYNSLNPTIQAEVEDAIGYWMTSFFPGYNDLMALTESTIERSILQGGVLADGVEDAILARAMSRLEAEARGNQRQSSLVWMLGCSVNHGNSV